MAHDPRDDRERFGEQGRYGRPERLGDRNARHEVDDPDYGAPRYGSGPASEGFAGGGGGMTSDPDSLFGAVGYDPSFSGPRFDRQDVGSTGTHGVHPVSSPFGADYRGAVGVTASGGFSSSARRYAQIQRYEPHGHGAGPGRRHDPHYAAWRQRQVEALDRDYEDYCREHQARFDDEFGAWRSRRGAQRQAVDRVREQMEVVGSDGRHVGTVDGARDDSIVLTRNDPNAGGVHHRIPCSWVDSVDDKVRLNIGSDEAMRRWQEAERSGALFDSRRG